MELTEDNVPESILFDLLAEYVLFSLTESKVVTIFFYDLVTVSFAYPVAEGIPEHRTNRCE